MNAPVLVFSIVDSCRYTGLGPQRVGLPHIRPLEGKLWEMRMTGRDGIARAVYAAIQGRRLLVLHVFIKKTQTTPRKAIETALKRLEAAS